MSTLRVSNLQNEASSNNQITLGTDGFARLNGLAYPNEGSLSGRNRVINGDMRVSQRGSVNVTAGGSSTYVAADRFQVINYFGSGQINTAISTSVVPAGFKNSLSLTVNTAVPLSGTTGYYVNVAQTLEGFNIADCYNQSVTLSFWVRSSITGTYSVGFFNSTNTGSTSATRLYVANYSISAANTWEQKTITVNLAAGTASGTWDSATGAGLTVAWGLGAESNRKGNTFLDTWGTTGSTFEFQSSSQVNWASTAGATFYITGVQLESGSVATPIEHRSIAQELALCQRYYYTHARENGFSWGVGTYYASNLVATHIYFPVSMRSAPTLDYTTGTNYYGAYSNAAFDAFDAMAIARAQQNGAAIDTSTGTSGTAGYGCVLATNNANSFIAFTAEL